MRPVQIPLVRAPGARLEVLAVEGGEIRVLEGDGNGIDRERSATGSEAGGDQSHRPEGERHGGE